MSEHFASDTEVEYSGIADVWGSVEFDRATRRERGLRDGTYTQKDERELRWAAEGPRPKEELETARGG